MQAKEATLTRTNSEMSHRTQELESELNTAREEVCGVKLNLNSAETMCQWSS